MRKLIMSPAPSERLLRFVGDRVQFALSWAQESIETTQTQAFLRTNLGRAAAVRSEIHQACTGRLPAAGASWRDIPMQWNGQEWRLDLPVTQVGYFKAKAYARDASGRQIWPEGADLGITIHPDRYRTANVIYCAFPRLFGPGKTAAKSSSPFESVIGSLDQAGYNVIPNSGKLRDLTKQLPHIIDGLGCRILHLLPVNPTPTTYARFGRFGSPYAALDFTAIDPALIEFDKKTTGIDQFCELTHEVHARGGRVFLDLAINHTGWGSRYQENHPEWFLRLPDGNFASPGAWGTTWEDLCELSHRTPDLWEDLAEVFLVWCRRGVDGFRCDAGYKVPVAAWQYVTARVREEFPETIFLLEGLGGAWAATETLLADGGMQWAYSELFQNYSGTEVASYLHYSLAQSQRAGLWIHYSETHDNPRLAAKGRLWSLLRNRLCALTSVSGGFGYTCGVEWLATEKILVHQCAGLAWGNSENLLPELKKVADLLSDHPCFFDGAVLTRLSGDGAPVYALRRESAEGLDRVLVLINTDAQQKQRCRLPGQAWRALGQLNLDLLGQPLPQSMTTPDGGIDFSLAPGAAYCLAAAAAPTGLNGGAYRVARAQAAWALTALSEVVPDFQIGPAPWRLLADLVTSIGPERFLTSLADLDRASASQDLIRALLAAADQPAYPEVIHWALADQRRITLVPPNHWLLLSDPEPFDAVLTWDASLKPQRKSSVRIGPAYVLWFSPAQPPGEATLRLDRFSAGQTKIQARLRFLRPDSALALAHAEGSDGDLVAGDRLVLFTNGRGGMARLGVDVGRIRSKYDCLLAANLNPVFPVDRHVFAKRARLWVNADGFLSPLDGRNLAAFAPGPPGQWRFVANAGDGRTVELELQADMLDQRNTTVLRFHRPARPSPRGVDLPEACQVTVTVRVDLEDRNFHWETHRNSGAEAHFTMHSHLLPDRPGFAFTPAADRHLRVFADAGRYHHEPEWCVDIPHPVEASRGQWGSGDAYSPGWFEMPLRKGERVTLILCADDSDPALEEVRALGEQRSQSVQISQAASGLGVDDPFGQRLLQAVQAFLVRRDSGKTVIAGYPWFLDWGRDTLICSRGLLAAGLYDDVKQILVTYGRYEENGTLPNCLFGQDVSNRETSDAPLWFGLVCEDMAHSTGEQLYATPVNSSGRTLADVLNSIATGYIQGTPTGIRMDPHSGLIFSPSHFTWMDTNYPACTPREGYPVEIQALWIRLLRQLERLLAIPVLSQSPAAKKLASLPTWRGLADRAEASFQKLFWIADRHWLADLLVAPPGVSAEQATVDTALRSNYLIAISLGLVSRERAQAAVAAAARHLVVPGALRSLAPLPVSPPLPIKHADGKLLNNPREAYWGRYEGDEDTRRKPAYHNGTAWTWTFPMFCEALVRAWDFSPASTAAAKAYLGSIDHLLRDGCVGHLPEITDGDAPHTQRGCDAQAWGITEALRVWKLLNRKAG